MVTWTSARIWWSLADTLVCPQFWYIHNHERNSQTCSAELTFSPLPDISHTHTHTQRWAFKGRTFPAFPHQFLTPFLQEKVNSIHRHLLAPVHQLQDFIPPAVHLSQCSLSSVNSSQVTTWIFQAKASTYTLDHKQTMPVKTCLPALCLLIVDIVSSSLETGVVPFSFKTTSVTPIL